MSKQYFNSIEYKLSNILSGRHLIMTTFIISVLTTFYSLWLISTLDQVIKISSLDEYMIHHKDTPESMTFVKDVIGNILRPAEGLSFSSIKAEQISILGKSDSNEVAGIHISKNRVVMQAQEYNVLSSDMSDNNIKLPEKFKVVESKYGFNNVKLIKSLHSSVVQNENLTKSNLEISSNKILNLSGNRGVTISGKNLLIESPEKVTLRSKGDSIIISAPKGIHLASLANENTLTTSTDEELPYTTPNYYKQRTITINESGPRHNVCIDKKTGLISLCNLKSGSW